VGAEAVIELVKPRTGCDRFEAIQGHPPSEAAGRMGVMARVLRSGSIQVGDEVKIL
jgi:MOSC domain-containing protein YiiM